jgi:hypothetical protein
MSNFKPFKNEEDSLTIDDLTIENRLDRISLYGSVQLTRDKTGLQHARQLKEVVDAVVAALEAEKGLPEHIAVKPTDKVDNPFSK